MHQGLYETLHRIPLVVCIATELSGCFQPSFSEEEMAALKNEVTGSRQKQVVNDTVRIWIRILILLKK